MRCVCNKRLSDAELRYKDPITGKPNEYCFDCIRETEEITRDVLDDIEAAKPSPDFDIEKEFIPLEDLMDEANEEKA